MTPLEPASKVSAAKAPASSLARTDPALLARKDSTPIPVLVKLDYESLASYRGGVSGYAATSPARTGRKLSGAPAEQRYGGYVAGRESAFVGALAKRVPQASVGHRLRTVYGGVSAVVPANKVGELLRIDGVVAVQQDVLRKPLTDASGAFIGATSLYPRLGGTRNAGKGVVVGVIDTGAWPEHPSFADQGNLGAPPAKPDGTPRTCDFGDNPLTPAVDVFACNRKLIGGARFLDTYDLVDDDDVYRSARDSGGHGTHTASTAVGNVVGSASVFGVERGPLAGTAPGAWLSVYKVLGPQGGFTSDIVAAIQQSVKDGVDVLNYSIGGGGGGPTDPSMQAFRDAYAAGVFVSASAGNSGPGAGTVDNFVPWVTTVAASTQTREFSSTLTLRGGAETLVLTGASITAGVPAATPVVLAESVEGYAGGALCQAEAAAGTFSGKIVACQRGVNGRVEKGHNVARGGAVGMILYNPSLQDIETDNHFLPTVHLADGTAFKTFMAGHTDVTASFTPGQKGAGKGDVMAAFSSRGPGGLVLKPDISGPGVQILAGNTPTPDAVDGGPPGQYYQAIAGTSMSAPHIAGSAALLAALHPSWTPGQIKSAMMTTAKTSLLKEDETTKADPLDYGSGRIDLTRADDPGLTFDETADRMLALGADPVNAVHLNIPSVDAKVMPGTVSTVRTAKNVTGRTQTYTVRTSAPAKSRVTVSPSRFTLKAGKSTQLRVTISSTAPTGQYFGEIQLLPASRTLPALHLPVAFVPQQGDVTLATTCTPDSVAWLGASTCTVTAENTSSRDTTADLTTTTTAHLPVQSASGAKVVNPLRVERKNVSLAGQQAGVPSLGPGSVAGEWIPLSELGVVPEPLGDEDLLNFTVPEFVFNGVRYTSIGVDSNGYLVAGETTAEDNNCCLLPASLPDPARPNNVLAPFWTDLDGTGAPGLYAATLEDGSNVWLVLEWQVNVWGTTSNRHFQVWIGLNGTQDIVFAYDPGALPANPNQPFLVGAENADGSGGDSLPAGTLPTGDLRITSTDPTPGGSASYTVRVRGLLPGTGTVTSTLTSPIVPGTTVVTENVTVNQPRR
ncbi:S8 family serine peptidase [Plantactinospora solaniradicis]|uniref:S8 family serine peptidase n=1 Tax=Plantactinospora solaniradicis TaxID=1723736 RepID=A0ABW1K9Q4_9ACTN